MDTSAIIFVNNDLSGNVQEVLMRQLFIHEAMTGTEFDARVSGNPSYPEEVHLNNLRILVIRSFYEETNRDLADVVIFIKAGLASIEANKFGPPGLTLPVDHLYLHEILHGILPGGNQFSDHDLTKQNNILYPLIVSSSLKLNPFGTD